MGRHVGFGYAFVPAKPIFVEELPGVTHPECCHGKHMAQDPRAPYSPPGRLAIEPLHAQSQSAHARCGSTIHKKQVLVQEPEQGESPGPG